MFQKSSVDVCTEDLSCPSAGWETKYGVLLQMVNVQNFDAKIYQHVIKWHKAMMLI
jgi:hypothetical protein